jgi:hypothetical protein
MVNNENPIRRSPARLAGKEAGYGRGTAFRRLGELVHVGSRAVGLSTVALILLAACSAGGSGSAGGTGSASPSAAANLADPQRALFAAATQAQKMTSVTETVNIRESGVQNSTSTGTLQLQRTPTRLIAENVTVTSAGKSTHIKAIITGTAFYLNAAALASQIGKPWLKVDLSALHTPALATLGQLVRSVQSNNAFNLTQLFAASKKVRVAGSQNVDGVPTTEYAGSFQASELAKVLAPGLRKALGPALQALGNSIVTFHIWIDGQHQVRKEAEVESVSGLTINTIVTITAINQPIHITIPPASQTYNQPGL